MNGNKYLFSVGTSEWFLASSDERNSKAATKPGGIKTGTSLISILSWNVILFSVKISFLFFFTCFWSQLVTIKGLLPLINKETFRFSTPPTIIDGQSSTRCIMDFNKNCLWMFERQSATSRCFLQVFIQSFKVFLLICFGFCFMVYVALPKIHVQRIQTFLKSPLFDWLCLSGIPQGNGHIVFFQHF